MPTTELPAFTGGDAASAMGGRLISGGATYPIRGVSIDSRSLSQNELFFAIRGERFDGHAFVTTALQQGACGVVVSDMEIASETQVRQPVAIIITVDDTTRALQRLAQYLRRASGAQVVAITGSVGKTTTKELTADLLSTHYRVFKTPGNLNNHIGLPLSLIELRHKPEIAVVEIGMRHSGEISTLVTVAEPEVRVWTNVAAVHAEYFDSIGAIADAKAEIMSGATVDSLLIVNAGDERIMERVHTFAGCVTTFGIEKVADVMAIDVNDHGLEGTTARVKTPVGAARLRSPLLGRGNLANVLAAMAVALHYQVPLSAIVQRISAFSPLDQRGEIVRLHDGVTLIDDSYNSNPTALLCTFEAIRQESRSGRLIGILGEMLELGSRSKQLHEECGRAAAAVGFDVLITVGDEPAEAIGKAAVAAGMPPGSVTHMVTSQEVAEHVTKLVCPGDLVLVKGSRGVRTDLVVRRLRAELT